MNTEISIEFFPPQTRREKQDKPRLQGVFLLIFGGVPGEGGGLHGLDAVEVLMGVEGVGFQLDHGHGDIGAVIGGFLTGRAGGSSIFICSILLAIATILMAKEFRI